MRVAGAVGWAGVLVLAIAGCDPEGATPPHSDARVCSEPFPPAAGDELRAAVSVADGVVSLAFPLHVVGSYAPEDDGRGLPEAVEGALQEPGAQLALNELTFPQDALTIGTDVTLAAGDGLRLAGFLTAEQIGLAADEPIPVAWVDSYREALCRRSCAIDAEGGVLCGVDWRERYVLEAPGSEATFRFSAFGTAPGDEIAFGLTGVLRVGPKDKPTQDCCSGVRIELRGTVGAGGEVALHEYCADPWDVGCRHGDPGWNLRTDFTCRADHDSEAAMLEACRRFSDGSGPKGGD